MTQAAVEENQVVGVEGIPSRHEAPWGRVSFAPPEAWVEPEPYDTTLRAKEGIHVTYLLIARQVHADTGRQFHMSATRLETSLAVQHQSQWSLEFDPRAQHLTLHWLRIVRAGVVIDHLRRERMRLIQRETQLEHLVIDGAWTLLLVLDDVRPGDVIEAAYTYETRHPIRGLACEVFFGVPPQHVVARFRLLVKANAAAPGLAWKASSDAPARREEPDATAALRWVWEGSQTTAREPEANQPSSFLDSVWVQVSDLAAWSDLAAKTEAAWAGASDVDGLAATPAFARPARVDAAAVNQLVAHIQEDFRYLSINLDAGGWVPAAPGVVARRRYGDCKDLAWLSTTVLRSWGVTARPILVGTGLREQIAALLPMASLLNHAIMEVEIEGQRRWFDLTIPGQGGDFAGRVVSWFGQGLPVDASDPHLRSQPGTRSNGVFVLRETILLDTTRGGVSVVEQRVRVEGWHADSLRRARRHHGADDFAKERETDALRRYGKARRVGSLEWRDDVAANVCELVEVFEITQALYAEVGGQRAVFDVPPNLINQSFLLPEEKARRGPWSMPFPMELRHEITIKAGALGSGGGRRRRWEEPEFTASLEDPRGKGAWTRTVRFVVAEPEVSAARLPAYRNRLEELFRETGWRIYLPWGQVRPHRGDAFGKLPPAEAGSAAYVPPSDATDRRRSSVPTPLAADEIKLGRGSRRRERSAKEGGASAANPIRSGARSSSRSSIFPPEAAAIAMRVGVVVLLVLFAVIRGCVSNN